MLPAFILSTVPAATRSINTNSSPFFPGNKKLGLQRGSSTARSAGWRGSSPRRGPDDATPRFFRPSSAVFLGKFDTPVCQLFWHVSPLRPLRSRDERRGADTRVPAIYSASRNDMRVVQSNIGTGEEDKKEDGRMESVAKEDRKRERRRFNFLIRPSNGAPTEFHSPPPPPCSSSKLRINVLSFYFVSFIDSSFFFFF